MWDVCKRPWFRALINIMVVPVECTNGTLGVHVLNDMVNGRSSKGGYILLDSYFSGTKRKCKGK
jgi:hypothetical protein